MINTIDLKKLIFPWISSKEIPSIKLDNLTLNKLSGKFYHHPSKSMQLIGITGTNGKTTVAYFIAQWLNFLGKNSGIMGTLGYDYHKNMMQYENAKWKLFSEIPVLKYIINIDDDIGKNWIMRIPQML
uniref:Mur ligase central domain-containing protein n=1 Tax=Glossina pallidipes TaxID=7398 RepID=A0A1A9Z0W1_GLOPL